MTSVSAQSMIHCSRGVPPPEAIPSAALAAHAEAVLRDSPHMAFQYAPLGRYLGDAMLREQLAALHGVDKDCIFVGNGSLQVLDLVSRVLLQSPRRVVYVESPTYDRAIRIFRRHGAQVIGVPLEPDGLNVDTLRHLVQQHVPAFLYVIPDFQNPSGITVSAAEFPVIEDSPYRRLRYQGTAPPYFYELASGDVITISSLSKVLSPGLRIGYAIARPELARRLAEDAEDTYLSPAPFCQQVAARAMAAGLVEANVARCIDLFLPRWRSAIAAVTRRFGDQRLAIPDGGYFLGLYVRGSERTMLAVARDAGVALTPGHAFFPDGGQDDVVFVRLPFQALEPWEFENAVERLAAIAHHAAPCP